jgi:hypothetical protein
MEQLLTRTVNPRKSGYSLSGWKNEKCCSQLSTYFKRLVAFRKADESLVCSDKTLGSFFKPALLRSKTSITSESFIDE